MRQFHITGMSCAACQARVEKAVSKLDGVSSCSVSLLTNSMGVEGSASDEAIIRAVTEAGYGAFTKGKAAVSQTDALQDRDTPALKKRLLWSIGFLLVLMYFSMGHRMWGWPIPVFFEENYLAQGLVQLLLTVIVMIINRKFFVSGFKSVLHGAPNMDTLVALGASASFIWSVYALFMMTAQTDDAAKWAGEFYFESTAMILTLITVGKTLEARSKGKTTDALRSLMELSPKTAAVVRNGMEQTVGIDEVRVGDIFLVRPGESIPVDGIVLEGCSAVNEAALTGESIPVDKIEGDWISAATVNQSGFLRCEAARVGEHTTLSQIIRMVSDAAATKAPIAKTADKVSAVFVPAVIGIALVTFTVWILLGKPADFALARAISVLVISCPCALGLATPVAIMVGSGVGAKHGVLFKTAASLEEAGKVQIVVLDKTGTVTSGEPTVTEIIPTDGVTETELLRLAYAVEVKSEHPLAKAIVREAEKRSLFPAEVNDFKALPGNGVSAVLNSEEICGGSVKFISSHFALPPSVADQCTELAAEGCTPLLFCKAGKLMGIIAVTDTVKPESPEAVRELLDMGLQVVMLTGDGERTAKAVAERAGIKYYIAGVLPDGKEKVIRRLSELGRVAMVGDGINDAPALTCADVGIAVGAGTDVAIDAADIVLMNSRLSDVPAMLRLSRATLRNIRENLFWAFFYNILGIPLAAGCYIGLFGWQLDPMFAAAAMSLSSFCVVSNALRLNLFDMYSAKRDGRKADPVSDREISFLVEKLSAESSAGKIVKTLHIDGMMCPHCEASVTKALESISGVESASASHKEGIATVTLNVDVANELLIKAVEDEDYTVLSVE